MTARPKHTKTGNCSHASVLWRGGELQDACPDHDEPRGECTECPRCPACDSPGVNTDFGTVMSDVAADLKSRGIKISPSEILRNIRGDWGPGKSRRWRLHAARVARRGKP